MPTIEITEAQQKSFEEKGITDPIAHLESLILYEEFISEYHPQPGDEAWSYVDTLMADEEESDD